MNTKKIKIIDFAKELYLQVDGNGQKIYTWDKISKEIQKRFKKKVHYSTIAKWAVKPGEEWVNLFEKIKMIGIEKGKEILQEKENKIIDAKADDIALIYSCNKQRQNLSHRILMAKLMGDEKIKIKISGVETEIETTLNPMVVQRALEHSENTILALNDKKGDSNINEKRRKDISELFPDEKDLMDGPPD